MKDSYFCRRLSLFCIFFIFDRYMYVTVFVVGCLNLFDVVKPRGRKRFESCSIWRTKLLVLYFGIESRIILVVFLCRSDVRYLYYIFWLVIVLFFLYVCLIYVCYVIFLLLVLYKLVFQNMSLFIYICGMPVNYFLLLLSVFQMNVISNIIIYW